jgi:histidine triad (HIT) family protein
MGRDVVREAPKVRLVRSGCVFCDVVAGRVAAFEVLRDDVAVAFLDKAPLFPGHTLVVPVRHAETLGDLEPHEVGPYFARVAMNNKVSQSVPHLHVHVVPRTRGDGLRGFFWPRRRYADGEADAYAQRLRRALADAF